MDTIVVRVGQPGKNDDGHRADQYCRITSVVVAPAVS